MCRAITDLPTNIMMTPDADCSSEQCSAERHVVTWDGILGQRMGMSFATATPLLPASQLRSDTF